MEYDVLIIGAGMSGLAAGIRLAHYGKKVEILEKHAVLGGLNSFYKKDGRLFDVGLHAVTNYVPPGTKRAPLTKLLRQLRIKHEDLDLTPQLGSKIWFPGCELRMTNEPGDLEADIAEKFPSQIDGFRRLVADVLADDGSSMAVEDHSARKEIKAYIQDPLLEDMIFCPVTYYGSAIEDDMEWGQFKIMFRSLYLEGFARPYKGVRHIIQILRKKFLALGGKLRMKAGVQSLKVKDGAVHEVELESGEVLRAKQVLSSAGLLETLKLCSDFEAGPEAPKPGKLGFVETISVIDKQPKDLGIDETIIFFSTRSPYRYREPEDFVDPCSGVVCMPNNYAYDTPLDEGFVRITSLANYDRWAALERPEYEAKKKEWYDIQVAETLKFLPDFRPHVVYVDSFTPTTVKRFTFHERGAIYGGPKKVKDGKTHLENLFLCGTDQGYLGIIGAILSGISMANMHLMK